MISSRNKPGWLRKAQHELDDLWDQHAGLSDLIEDCNTDRQITPIYTQLNRIEKDIEKAEHKYKKLYSIWNKYLGLKIERAKNNEPVVGVNENSIDTVNEILAKENSEGTFIHVSTITEKVPEWAKRLEKA